MWSVETPTVKDNATAVRVPVVERVAEAAGVRLVVSPVDLLTDDTVPASRFNVLDHLMAHHAYGLFPIDWPFCLYRGTSGQ